MLRRLLTTAALLAVACDGNFTAPADGEEHTWEYTAYDFNNQAVVAGTFIVRAQGRDFTGTWETRLLKAGAEVGPQVGTGDLRGSWDVEGRSVFFDMNPGWADNNVFLVGAPDGSFLKGNWSHSTLLGVVSGGQFTASRQD
jgi:hypothetical protein